jgi:magnesium-transporting ATPase (P-type)
MQGVESKRQRLNKKSKRRSSEIFAFQSWFSIIVLHLIFILLSSLLAQHKLQNGKEQTTTERDADNIQHE